MEPYLGMAGDSVRAVRPTASPPCVLRLARQFAPTLAPGPTGREEKSRMTTPDAEQRSAARFDTAMPVEIGGAPGRTQNISASGVYFETDVRRQIGELVNFTVEFTLHGQRHQLLCEGKVVRVDQQGGRIGVAAKLVTPFFGDVESVEVAPPRREPAHTA